MSSLRVAEITYIDGEAILYGVADAFKIANVHFTDDYLIFSKSEGTEVLVSRKLVRSINVFDEQA